MSFSTELKEYNTQFDLISNFRAMAQIIYENKAKKSTAKIPK